MTDRLEAWIPVDGFPGFEVKLLFLSKAEMQKLQKAATKVSFVKNQKTEEMDWEIFLKAFSKNCVLDWKGFTLEHAANMLPIVVPKNTDMTQEIEFSDEEAYYLLKNSTIFEAWLNNNVLEINSFRR
jgi:hypothetical protein